MRPLEVLVVQHEPETPAGWLGDGLAAAGVHLTTVRPYAGEALPADVQDRDGLVVLGGAVDSWDDAGAPWLPGTRELVRAAEQDAVPVLGVCLGHQVAAAALGGRVGRNPAGTTLAVLPVGWTASAAGDPLFGPAPPTLAVHWNNDVVLELPPATTVLAHSPDGAVQAARLGRSVWGVQFHPEAGSRIVGDWLAGGDAASADAAPSAAGVDAEEYLAEIRRHEATLEEGGRRLADAFASLLQGARR